MDYIKQNMCLHQQKQTINVVNIAHYMALSEISKFVDSEWIA